MPGDQDFSRCPIESNHTNPLHFLPLLLLSALAPILIPEVGALLRCMALLTNLCRKAPLQLSPTFPSKESGMVPIWRKDIIISGCVRLAPALRFSPPPKGKGGVTGPGKIPPGTGTPPQLLSYVSRIVFFFLPLFLTTPAFFGIPVSVSGFISG